jgi:hypothetical protein
MDDLIKQQDEQRTARAFIGFLSTAFGVDQSTAGQDGYIYNQPTGYQSIGPTGVAMEGLPISTTQGGAVVLSPGLLLLAAGLAAGYFLTR